MFFKSHSLLLFHRTGAYGWFLPKVSPLEFVLLEKTSLLWPGLCRPWPFDGPPADRDFWLLLPRCCFLCLLTQTSHVHGIPPYLYLPKHVLPPCLKIWIRKCCWVSLWQGMVSGRSGRVSGIKEVYCPSFLSKGVLAPLLLPAAEKCPETTAPPSSDFSKHLQELVTLQVNSFRHLGWTEFLFI